MNIFLRITDIVKFLYQFKKKKKMNLSIVFIKNIITHRSLFYFIKFKKKKQKNNCN